MAIVPPNHIQIMHETTGGLPYAPTINPTKQQREAQPRVPLLYYTIILFLVPNAGRPIWEHLQEIFVCVEEEYTIKVSV